MSIEPGTYSLGPENSTLTVRTGRRGAIAKVGHDLRIEVASWSGRVDLGAAPEQTVLELTADSGSLRVREGSGGLKALGEEERSGIDQTITEEVLKGATIAFRSSAVTAGPGEQLRVEGELELAGATHPIAFDLSVDDDGQLSASTTLKQTAWGMKPYTALFGTLKVADEVEVSIVGRLAAG